MKRTACCCCGDATITIEGDPAQNGICNCASCKKRTGSAFGWSVYFADTAIIAKTGTTNVYTGKNLAGPYKRHFCSRCGTTLYWKSQNFMPEFTGIAGGCFVADPIPPPDFSVSDAQRHGWARLPDDWKKYP